MKISNYLSSLENIHHSLKRDNDKLKELLNSNLEKDKGDCADTLKLLQDTFNEHLNVSEKCLKYFQELENSLLEKDFIPSDYFLYYIKFKILFNALKKLKNKPLDSIPGTINLEHLNTVNKLSSQMVLLFRNVEDDFLFSLRMVYTQSLLIEAEKIYEESIAQLSQKKFPKPFDLIDTNTSKAFWKLVFRLVYQAVFKAYQKLTPSNFFLNHVKQLIGSNSNFKSEFQLIDPSSHSDLIEHFVKLCNDIPTIQWVEEELVKPLSRHCYWALLCDNTGAEIMALHHQNKDPLYYLAGPQCAPVVFNWGHHLRKSCPDHKPNSLSNFSLNPLLKQYLSALTLLNSHLLPESLSFSYIYQGQSVLNRETVWQKKHQGQLIQISHKVRVYEISNANTVACEGVRIAHRASQVLNLVNQSPQSKLKTDIIAIVPPCNITQNVTQVEITLMKLEAGEHVVSFTKTTLAEGDVIYLFKDAEEIELRIPANKLHEVIHQYFKVMDYSNIFHSYSVRNIDNAIAALIGLEALQLQVHNIKAAPTENSEKSIEASILPHLTALFKQNITLSPELLKSYQEFIARASMPDRAAVLNRSITSPDKVLTPSIPNETTLTPAFLASMGTGSIGAGSKTATARVHANP